MPSFLGTYEGSRKDPISKFHRAVKSFIDQDYPKDKCELIIISDACDITIREFKRYESATNIHLIEKKERSNGFPGLARQMGVDSANYEIVSYLDSDDYFMDYRLSKINSEFEEDCKFMLDVKRMVMYESGMYIDFPGNIGGTWQLIHNKSFTNKNMQWEDSVERGEDTTLIKKMMLRSFNSLGRWNSNAEPHSVWLQRVQEKHKLHFKELGGYVICHIPIIAGSNRLESTDI